MTLRNSQRWKRHERDIATDLGTTRHLHRDGKAGADVIIGRWHLQSKTRVELPRWFTDAMNQARGDTPEDGIPAVVIVHARGQGCKPDRYVLMTFDDWMTEVLPERGAE